ncbi:MAG: hypothetical protein LBS92_06535 [Candidatus Methanoplasma sp.]|jgi:antitoxin component of MazEF toxin-antitoxin module|nr:hypothetical protein [Candidatus Methanoplasma sp.]
MVRVNGSKFGINNRISLVSPLPELLGMEHGEEIVFFVENGEVIIRKKTRRYNGFDFESKEIKERLDEFERKESESIVDISDSSNVEQTAFKEYQRDKARRKSL